MSGIVDALDLPFEEAIRFFSQKLNMTAKNYHEILKRARTEAFTISGAMAEDLLEDFRKEIEKALEDGISLNEFLSSFNDIVIRHGWSHTGTPGWRARIIYETNLSQAYQAGRYAQQTEPETLEAFPYWQYVHSGSPHPRLEHQSWDGLVFRADDPWFDTHYPQNGFGCGCWIAVVSERRLRRMGKNGPDPVPPTIRRDWVDPKTGKQIKVSNGIDPGFDYNPGKVWLSTKGKR